MAQTYRSRYLATQRDDERQMAALFEELAALLAAEVLRRADAEGNVPRSATLALQATAAERVTRLFLGPTRAGSRAPFETLPNGALIPLSPYMRVLWGNIRPAVQVAVEQQANVMQRRLPPDIATALRQAQRNPFIAAQTPIQPGVFRPNPLARYDPPHLWVDARGYTLSDRVWNVAGNTRRRLDLYLDQAIAEGRGAATIARELEQFLVPGRHLRRTRAPYGTDASYDAMRLARTEITAAHGRAFETAAAMNPFVAGKQWVLSPRHGCCDICDERARGGENGDGVYPLDDPINIPGSSHPHCMCTWRNVLIGAAEQEALFEDLRADIRRSRRELTDLIGPLRVEQFTNLLLGQGFAQERVMPLAA